MGQSLGPIDLGCAFKIRVENKEGFTREIKEKKKSFFFWNYDPLFFLYLFQKLKTPKIFLPLPWPRYNL